MRLIDADALLNSGYPTIYHTEFGDEVINTDDIRNAPTIEWTDIELMGYVNGEQITKIKPSKIEGHWIFHKANEEHTDGYECSVCKTTYHTRVPYFSEFNFCPNCGARMKGAEDEL